MNDEERAVYLAFVHRSFRDMADMDYIGARVLYRSGLLPPFLNAANQAIEKYLKAILLYNDRSAKGLGHDLEKALARIGDAADLQLDLPEDVQSFIKRLNGEGGNRYFEFPMRVMGDELLHLDRAVWHLRRHADWHPPSELLGRKRFSPVRQEHVHKFRLWGGYLERVLKKGSEQRKDLVWKNFYYGARKKRWIKLERRMEFANPAHSLDPWIFPLLSKVVDFSKDTKAWFANSGE
ncbi:MAG: HEPN domain-containing protein [Vicinamibacteria bacterium]